MGEFNFYADVADLDEEDEDGVGYGAPGRDSVIVAVDCCKKMFQTSDEDEFPFARVCEAVRDMLKNKIICSENDLQGLLFFGTDSKKNQEDFDHIYTVQELDVPSASRIEELQELQSASATDFKKKYGHDSDYQVSELLWCCSSMFTRCTQTLSMKTLVIFTWEDDPHIGDKNANLRARTKAKDLLDLGIDVQVLSFNKNFTYDKFYKDIMSDPENEPPFAENPIDGIKNLYDFLLRKCSKQRTLAKIPFQLCPGVEMAIGVYTVARRATKGTNINIDSKTNQQVFAKTNLVETSTGEILMPSDIKYLQKWGDRDIVFDDEEKKEMSRFGAGLTLLGFKPKEKAIKIWRHVRTSQFIYPSESTVKGSSTLFSALLIKCIEKNVVPICRLATRTNSAPRCVALLPQQEEVDESTGEQTVSPGFFVIYLPFSDDLRNIEVGEGPTPTDEQVEAAEAVIKKLRFKYEVGNFDNPALQTHYQNLEAMALEKDEPDSVTDYTLPNNDRIAKKAGVQINLFKESVYPKDYVPTSTSKPAKRKATSSAAGSNKKPALGTVNFREYATQGSLGELTVPVLKEFCRDNGISVSGKKSNFIKAIETFFA